jgi:eukaryotic-like serine/threonine-protein kinase
MLSSMPLLSDRYRLERKLGSGGMAIVWLARDTKLDRHVAIKILSDVLSAAPGFRERFDREARTAANLSHPNLVRIYDYGSEEDRPYLVMEYVDGETLAERTARGGLDEEAGERLARELLGALSVIHAAGVIHRDVKPSNVLLDRGGQAHLTDFGIAQTGDGTRLTETGHVIGTRGYMAPEVLEGGDATARSDLYSAGVVLEEAAANPDRGRLASLIAQLTQPDPGLRPPSADEALRALSQAPFDPGETAATRPLPTSRTQPLATGPTEPIRRRRVPVWALALLLAVALAAIGVAALGGGSDQEPGSAKQPASTARTSPVTVTETTPAAPAQTTPAAPAGGTPAGAGSSDAASGCAGLEEQRNALDDEQHASDERFKDDPDAKKAAHDRIEAQKHALDDQLKACH